VATLVSEKEVEAAAKKVNDLIDDAKWSLVILRKTKYDVEALGTICENWNKALEKIERAKKTILEVVGQALAEIPCSLRGH
jgi:hypothetical protein